MSISPGSSVDHLYFDHLTDAVGYLILRDTDRSVYGVGHGPLRVVGVSVEDNRDLTVEDGPSSKDRSRLREDIYENLISVESVEPCL